MSPLNLLGLRFVATHFLAYQKSCLTVCVVIAYTVGAIVGGWFIGGPISDYLGRKMGMGIGCFLTIIATFMQTFAPKGNLGCFIGGRVIIGIGQGIALSIYS